MITLVFDGAPGEFTVVCDVAEEVAAAPAVETVSLPTAVEAVALQTVAPTLPREREEADSPKKARVKISCITEDEDFQLVNRLQAGDESALSELILMYKDRVCSMALNITHVHGDAEEVASAVWAIVWRRIGTFQRTSRLLTWICAITRNAAINKRAHAIRRKAPLHLSLDDTGGDSSSDIEHDWHSILASDEPGTVREIQMDELDAAMREEARRITGVNGETLRLRMAGLSYTDIATRTKTCKGTVRSRLSRARADVCGGIVARYPELREPVNSYLLKANKSAEKITPPPNPASPVPPR